VSGVVFAGLPADCPYQLFQEALRVLAPGGSIQASYAVTEHTIAKTDEQVSNGLVMGGFVEADSVITTVRSKAAVELHLTFSAKKPAYTNGGAQKLSLRKRGAEAVKAAPQPRATGAVKLSMMDLDEDDLVDEDELLDMAPEAAAPAQPRKEGDDCETGRGACENCTCGRKEGAMPSDAPAEPSACGNCYLGDAFRCAGCPSKGLPPFEPVSALPTSPWNPSLSRHRSCSPHGHFDAPGSCSGRVPR
jgi:hypothetical protein